MKNPMPVGFGFMEKAPFFKMPGSYNSKNEMWQGPNGELSHVLASTTATGSNCSTGASQESDVNEDYD